MTQFLKRNNHRIILLSIGLCFVCTNLYAQAITETVDKAALGKAQSFNNLGESSKAIPILEELRQKYPQNTTVTSEYIHALSNLKDNDKKKEYLKDFLAIYSPEHFDPRASVEVLGIMMSLELYDQAVELCRKYLTYEPDNKEVQLWLARILSWTKQYPESISVYDDLIKRSPDQDLYQREKARVLGWSRDFKGALETYQEAVSTFSDNSVISSEMRAKRNFYKFYDLNAAKYYEEWLSQEDENLEAMFDLAQVYSRQRQWDKAERLYKKVLELVPNHPQAKVSYEKLKILKEKKAVKAGFEYFEADSGSRSNDKRRYTLFEEVVFPVSDGKYHIRAGRADHLYNFSDLSSVQAHTAELGSSFIVNEHVHGDIQYVFSDYTENISDSHTGHVYLNIQSTDLIETELTYQREDIIENSTSLRNEVNRNKYQIRVKSNPVRAVELGADYAHSDYSDDNNRDTYGVDIAYHLMLAPRQLTARYRYEVYKFEEDSVNYFSPSSFHFNEFGLEWFHFLNEQELFWGSLDTYYVVGYKVNFDVNDQTGHRFYADLHKDWTQDFSTEVGWAKKFYEHDKTYGDQSFNLSGKLYF